MTSSIDRAKELLDAAEREVSIHNECTCPGTDEHHQVRALAHHLLCGYIGAIEALKEHCCSEECPSHTCGRAAALAEFDRLFPEEVD